MNLLETYLTTRNYLEDICKPLENEDYSTQPANFVSPPKWHLAHTTWFFEQFVLLKYKKNYRVFDNDFAYLFNSYYNNVGKRVIKPNRGLMTRPTVDEVYKYRHYVDEQMVGFLNESVSKEIADVIQLGLQHEQQHQELLYYDIKYILGNQPTFPVIENEITFNKIAVPPTFKVIKEGLYHIGHKGDAFCFDIELGHHKVWLYEFEISNQLVTNSEYIEFIESGAYNNFNLWHSDGWEYIQTNAVNAPLYWHKMDDDWYSYTLQGFKKIDGSLPVMHISFYEAAAFAEWKQMRLPTEFEWEIASSRFEFGELWEWTNSALLPYPNYKKANGALGEYNGKFMVNQMVLRGASVVTPKGHGRPTYRNFFYPDMRWMFSGIRLAK